MTTLPKIYLKLLPWFKKAGRHNLPWQISKNPYSVWISEVMLQQTQVATVIPYYLRFMSRFPTITALAKGDLDEVLALWAGLGYYSRARNLHRTAQIIENDYQSIFPDTLDALIQLPGIGQSTAAAILSLAYEQPHAILDGNVKRVLCRYYGILKAPDQIKKDLWTLAENNLSQTDPAAYTQAIMDLGALLCVKKNPQCQQCPLSNACLAYKKKLTDQIPVTLPKKKLETRKRYFALILNKQTEFFLIKRPEKGIWGGLWSLIESDTESDLKEKIKALPFPTHTLKKLPMYKHTFTHFKLELYPILFETNDQNTETDQQIWYHLEKANQYGLPKPIYHIIKIFWSEHESNCLLS